MLQPFTEQSPRPSQATDWDESPGFDYKELDALWVTKWTPESSWQPGQLYAHQGATLELSPGANVLHYGQAVFEGLKARRTRNDKAVLFRPIDNARRMRASSSRLMMEAPPVQDFLQAVTAVVRANARWIPRYRKGSLYIRPLLVGSGPALGVRPAQEYTFCVFASPVGTYMGGNRVIVLSTAHRAAPYGTGAAKVAGNYAASLLPQKMAKSLDCADALYCDAREDRYIEELSGANFFAILHDGTVVTPALGSILPGITRDSILTVAREVFHWPVAERRVSIDEILNEAVEAFYTGTAAVLSPITVVNYRGQDHPIGDGEAGPRAQMLLEALDEIQLQERPDYWDWVVEIDE
ncbi:MAG: branched-chain amino acid aminotransferase [Chloroflexi bacterium]|nr:branched-chain amino acid aminotransferase [Chloroflexota bacterium]